MAVLNSRSAAPFLVALIALADCSLPALAKDIYGPAANELQIPTLGIGNVTYSNVILSVNLPPISGPTGSSPNGFADTYTPSSNQLNVPAVQVGGVTYFNAVAAVTKLTSIGSISGADVYDGIHLFIPAVQVGATIYNNVELSVTVGDVARVNGGMPGAGVDLFDPTANQLTIPSVQVGNRIYTNVVLHAGINNIVCVSCPGSAPTVHLTAAATDPHGYALGYQWQVTDGTLQNVNGNQADWLLPAGPGLHFAYLLASNGQGGYAESRIPVNTDAIGSSPVVPAATPYAAPAAAAPSGVPYRIFSFMTASQQGFFNLANADLSVLDLTSGYEAFPDTDLKGSAVFQNFPVSSDPLQLQLDFGPAGVISGPMALLQPSPTTATPLSASVYSFLGWDLNSAITILNSNLTPNNIVGTVVQGDGNAAGVNESFFGKQALVSIGDVTFTYFAAVNDWNDFSLLLTGCSTTISAAVDGYSTNFSACQENGNLTQSPLDVGTLTLPNTASPLISTLTATLKGNPLATGAQQILPVTGTALPSDAHPQQDFFLAFKGSDDRVSACRYYQAIGAVPANGCDFFNNGNITSAISFQDWKRTVQIDSFSSGTPTVTAAYVNVVDLNLTRIHHSINYGPGNVAAYVCNHSAPTDQTQASVDIAVANAIEGPNLVACVAMDYITTPGVNGGQPFTRFLIFGPSGQLLPSVNLDGRGEKFVPGACIACHGGDRYAGNFPRDGSGFADVGGHWLPYDAGNFAFASPAGLTDSDQEPAIYQLNQNVLNTNPTPATAALIAGWYANGQTLNKLYVPQAWSSSTLPGAVATYQNVVARNCRTCHAALPLYNWDASPTLFQQTANCVIGSPNKFFGQAMPNSLVTYNRFHDPAQSLVSTYISFIGGSLSGYCSP